PPGREQVGPRGAFPPRSRRSAIFADMELLQDPEGRTPAARTGEVPAEAISAGPARWPYRDLMPRRQARSAIRWADLFGPAQFRVAGTSNGILEVALRSAGRTDPALGVKGEEGNPSRMDTTTQSGRVDPAHRLLARLLWALAGPHGFDEQQT